MSHPAGKKEESRAKILASAGRGFRAQGYGGLGVDGLAKAAGVTSGAFYAHFKSKTEAFRAAVHAGMADLVAGIASFRDSGGDWPRRFVDFYMGERREAELAAACALQSLTGEVARADAETRDCYAAELDAAVAVLAGGLSGDAPRADAIALLALLSGGVSMACAVGDPALAAEIVAAVRAAGQRAIA